MNDAKCKNCKNYKIRTTPFKVHPRKGRLSGWEDFASGASQSITRIGSIALIGFGLLLWVLEDFDSGALQCFVLPPLFILIVFYYIIGSQYRNLPVGYDYECENCGYKWQLKPQEAKSKKLGRSK